MGVVANYKAHSLALETLNFLLGTYTTCQFTQGHVSAFLFFYIALV
jgi:hypothetical protein